MNIQNFRNIYKHTYNIHLKTKIKFSMKIHNKIQRKWIHCEFSKPIQIKLKEK